MNQKNVLASIAWAETEFGSLATNRHCQRRDVLRAVKKGLAKSVGTIALVDDDGFTVQPERYIEGFALTDEGWKEVKKDNQHIG